MKKQKPLILSWRKIVITLKIPDQVQIYGAVDAAPFHNEFKLSHRVKLWNLETCPCVNIERLTL